MKRLYINNTKLKENKNESTGLSKSAALQEVLH
jgi:hypothetical protein